jgi:membrane-bound lytic murein transglycosylase D
MERHLLWRTAVTVLITILSCSCLNRQTVYNAVQDTGITYDTLQFVTNHHGEYKQEPGLHPDNISDTQLSSLQLAAIVNPELPAPLYPAQPVEDTTADRMARLDLVITREVLHEIHYLTKDKRDFFQASLNRSAPWIHEFRAVFEETGLPVELAWLPLIESGFRSDARSYMGAGGMWQFMPGTARYCGMELNTGFDERKDPLLAGRGAAWFLSYLYSHFNDWPLALAAYNYGGRNVKKALSKSSRKDFYSISRKGLIPEETRRYVPRLIATCLIIQDYEKYGFTMPELSTDHGYVTIDFITPLALAAKYAGITTRQARKLNPAITTAVIPKRKNGYHFRLPLDKLEKLQANLASLKSATREAYGRYKVKKNEALSQIAEAHGITTADLAAINEITNYNRIYEGQILYVPGVDRDTLQGDRNHLVRYGDTVSGIALHYGVSADNIIKANNLADPSRIRVGQVLKIEFD